MLLQRLAWPGLKCARHSTSAGVSGPSSSVLFVSFVWPEPSSSAAGVRTMSIVDACIKAGHKVHFIACANPNQYTEKLKLAGIKTHHVPPNRGEEFDAICHREPFAAVIFDRFLAEEAFSARVRENLPTAARILDMQVALTTRALLLVAVPMKSDETPLNRF